MKTLKLLIPVLLINMLLLSCSSDDNNNTAPTCEQTTAATLAASQAFANASDANYSALCDAYKDALQDQIDVCGDTSETLQAIIVDLEDCTLTIAPINLGEIKVTVGTLVKRFDKNITVTVSGTTRKIRAEYAGNSDFIYFEIQQGATGNIISNFNIHLLSSDYNILPESEGGVWSSNITMNSATAIDGTFYGYVTSPTTGADLSLTSGVIDLNL